MMSKFKFDKVACLCHPSFITCVSAGTGDAVIAVRVTLAAAPAPGQVSMSTNHGNTSCCLITVSTREVFLEKAKRVNHFKHAQQHPCEGNTPAGLCFENSRASTECARYFYVDCVDVVQQ